MWAGGRVGEDGGARDAAVRKFRSDPKRAVDEQRARLQSIELRIQVIAPSEPRQAVGKQVLLQPCLLEPNRGGSPEDRKSTRLKSSHLGTSYSVLCLEKKTNKDLHHHVRRPTTRATTAARAL